MRSSWLILLLAAGAVATAPVVATAQEEAEEATPVYSKNGADTCLRCHE